MVVHRREGEARGLEAGLGHRLAMVGVGGELGGDRGPFRAAHLLHLPKHVGGRRGRGLAGLRPLGGRYHQLASCLRGGKRRLLGPGG